MMRGLNRNNVDEVVKQLAWWLFFLVCTFYGAYAFYMGMLEILSLWGIAQDAPDRAAPVMFVIHALSGSVALVGGALQFNGRTLNKARTLHRLVGRVYVGAIWISSAGGLWSTIFFEADMAARIVFGLLSILWFSTTTIAFVRVRNRKFAAHREWMIRSFSLSLFFVSFSFWVPALASTDLPEGIAYPLGVFLGWSLNLIVAELWIRYTRSHTFEHTSTFPRLP